jgi:lysophosphatidic acid acyltransferase/lysophosphatidylinositol acyltransferase
MAFEKLYPIFHILFTLVFFVSGLITNLFQLLFFVLLWPHNKELFRKINYFFSYIIYSGIIYTLTFIHKFNNNYIINI